MRAHEFILLEYSRDITARNLGQKLIDAANKERDLEGVTIDDIGSILATIESKDPTPNKQYTQWLARVYSKGGVRLEDLNRNNLLGIFDLGKRRRMIHPNNADINRYTTYKAFEDMMDGYDLDMIQAPDEEELSKGNSEVLLDTPEVRIIYPKDEEAACYYGQGTRWCTAATKGTNYFSQYNRQGPIYILLPKKPMYPGEKYQLHFPSGQFMDKNDDQIPLDNLLKERFPSTIDWFLKNYPEIKEMVAFAPDEVLAPLIERIVELSEEFMNENLSDWQDSDDSFIEWRIEEARSRGYVDENGDVDWEKVNEDDELYDYMEYNPAAYDYYKYGSKALREITPEDVRGYQHENTDDVQTISNLDNIMADLIKDGMPSRVLAEGGTDLISFIQLDIYLSKTAKGWKVELK